MKNDYFFETDSYRFTLTELQLLRNRYAFKRIPSEHIQRLEIKKGITVKRPLLVILFGLTFVWAGFYLGYPSAGTTYLIIDGYYFDWEIGEILELLGVMAIASILLIIMGTWAIILACVPVPMMKIDLVNGKTLKLTLKKIRRAKQIPELILFLKNTFKPNHLEIHPAIKSR